MHCTSHEYLADKIITENNIYFVLSMKAYMVEGERTAKYLVTLVPKETCSCPSVGTCYQLLAVAKSVHKSVKKILINVRKIAHV